MKWALRLAVLLVGSCGLEHVDDDAGSHHDDAGAVFDAGTEDAGEIDAGEVDAGEADAGEVDAGEPDAGAYDPWADAVVQFSPGDGAGFGQDRFPGVVLGPPSGAGNSSGSTDVLSLGRDGFIDLEVTDWVIIDGPGVDLLVFENGFTGFLETGRVEVSDDGVTWHAFCSSGDPCAGLNPVYANPANGISGTDPAVAGGDAFDLFDVGLTRARFVRVRDSGLNTFYGAPGGGFDLDAIAVVNGERP